MKKNRAETVRSDSELEIRLMGPLQFRQTLLLVLSLAMSAALTWLAFYGLTKDPFSSSVQALVAAVIAVQGLLRLRYLKALFLRIDRHGCSWRLIDGVEIFQRIRPPISEHEVRWDALRELRHEASGIRFFRDGKKDTFLPLSEFSYAQRQDIKRIMALHLSAHGIPAHAFTPVGWHDNPGDTTEEIGEAAHDSSTSEIR